MQMMRCFLHICAPGFVGVGMVITRRTGRTRVRAWARALETLMLVHMMHMLLPWRATGPGCYRQKCKMYW